MAKSSKTDKDKGSDGVEEGEIRGSSKQKNKSDSKFVLTAGKFYGDADMPCCVTAVWTRPVCTETLPSSSSLISGLTNNGLL